MRRTNLATVIHFVIRIIVTLRTRRERARRRTKLHALMFRMTINATNSSSFMRLDHRRRKRRGAMTRRTALFHAGSQRVAVRTRAGVWRCGNGRNDAELRQRMRL